MSQSLHNKSSKGILINSHGSKMFQVNDWYACNADGNIFVSVCQILILLCYLHKCTLEYSDVSFFADIFP